MTKPLGTIVTVESLKTEDDAFELVQAAWNAADFAACHRSNFPVGSAVLAYKDNVGFQIFSGCNVENRFFPATICAERNAAITAIASGYKSILKVAIACKKIPGGNSCGLCRQVLTEWGPNAVVYNVIDSNLNVRRFQVKDLLPAAAGPLRNYPGLEKAERTLIRKLLDRKRLCHTPYSGQVASAVFSACNAAGRRRNFYGVTDDNASYGGSTSAEVAAMTAARSNGYVQEARLMVNCGTDLKGPNPLDGESLQKLREFGPDVPTTLVNDLGDAVHTNLAELLPDSFGPDSL